MWLIIATVAALAVTALWFVVPKKYKLGYLAMMLWGLSVMILVDHVLAYGGSGPFIEMETDGLIESGVVLGIAMLIPIFLIWEVMLLVSRLKEERDMKTKISEPAKG